jgi:signal peptidase I
MSTVRSIVLGRRPRRTLLRIAVTITTAIVVFGYVLLPVRGVGVSMTPVIEDGQLVFVNRLAYVSGAPRRGDIVALRAAGRRVVYVKRVVALPGERVGIDGGTIHVDGRPLDKPYVRDRRPWTSAVATLGNDEYLVLGDNRGMPLDAQSFGRVRRERMLGRVVRLP